MAKPRLSVLLPNYNHSQYLPLSLGALVDRERCPDEVIVIDDGSTDNSWEIIQEYARRYAHIRAYRNEKNMGANYTVDRAFGLAQGEYIYSGAADDFVLPGFFEKCMALLEQHPEAGLCCTIGDWRELHTGLNWHMGVGISEVPAFLSPQRLCELERRGRLFIAGHTVIVNKAVLVEAGRFPPATKYASDWYTYNLIGFKYGICVVPEVLAVNQINPNTLFLRGRRNKAADLEVMEAIVRLWSQEKWQDAVALMRESGALYVWGWPMLKTLMTHPEYRYYITPTFLRKNLWHIAKLNGKRFAPAWLVNFLARVGGYRAKPSGPKAA